MPRDDNEVDEFETEECDAATQTDKNDGNTNILQNNVYSDTNHEAIIYPSTKSHAVQAAIRYRCIVVVLPYKK